MSKKETPSAAMYSTVTEYYLWTEGEVLGKTELTIHFDIVEYVEYKSFKI